MTPRFAVPRAVREMARTEGPESMAWLDDLDGLIERLEQEWHFTAGAAAGSGTASFVCGGVRSGTEVALKTVLPTGQHGRQGLADEVRVLRATDGRGCVRVLRADLDRGVLLLERLGEQLVETNLDVEAQLAVICSTLPDVWSVPVDPQLRTGAAEAHRLGDSIRRLAAEQPDLCPPDLAATAIRLCESRAAAYDEQAAVLVHGDAHQWNTLRDPLRPGHFRFIDPDGLRAEREYDLAVLMREYTADLLGAQLLDLGRARARRLADTTGTDAQAIWEWAIVLQVVNGLIWLQSDEPVLAQKHLDVAVVWARNLRV